MTLFAIGDLHLPGGEEKPMDIFGDHWENHFEHIAADWRARVKDGDVVLIPGDISWAMQLERAVPDLQKIGALPGRKVLIKGNHDYWWNSVSKLRRVLPEGMSALQHDALDMGDFVVCGTRGWIPAFRNFSIISRNLLSAMSCDSIFISHSWSTLSKNPLISASTT